MSKCFVVTATMARLCAAVTGGQSQSERAISVHPDRVQARQQDVRVPARTWQAVI